MKILQAIDFMSLKRGGGACSGVFNLSIGLAKKGHDITLCISDYDLDKDYLYSMRDAGVTLRLFHNWFRFGGTCIQPDLINFDVKDYDVIHLNCYRSFQNVILSYKAMKYHIPFIIDSHGSNVKFGKKLPKELYDKVFAHLLNGADIFIGETNHDISIYQELGVDANKIKVMRGGIGIDEFQTIVPYGLFREKYGIKVPFILYVGRINKIKGIDFLVESFNQLLKLRDARLVIVGQDDGYKMELGNKINEMGIADKIIFTGFLVGDDKKSVLVDADMLAQTSIYEGAARPPLEAILCGTTVVVTENTGSGEEIKSMDGGFLVKYGDVTGLTNIMQYIIDNKEKIREKTLKARAYIKQEMSIEKQIERYENLYRGMIENAK